MTIKFSVNTADKYVVVTGTGQVTDEELFDAYVQFYRGDEWFPELNELRDLSRADVTNITISGLQKLAYLAERVQKQHHVGSVKIAFFTPDLHPFAMARVFDGMTTNLPRRTHVFRELHAAKVWLKKEQE